MYNYDRFARNYHTWRVALLNRIITIDSKFQLPWDSVLHLMDNMSSPETIDMMPSDLPDIAFHRYIGNEKYRRYILHVDDPDLLSPIAQEDRYVYLKTNMIPKFNDFRKKYKNFFLYLRDVSEIQSRKETLPVLNYNPLFRMRLTGRMSRFRKLNLIWGTIMNTMCKQPNKHHYLVVPFSASVFSKAEFIRTHRYINQASITHPNDAHYLFMMHFLNWIKPGVTTSLFQTIPATMHKNINFIFRHNDNAIIYNVADLMNMNEKDTMYVRIVNHMNMLALSDNEDRIQHITSMVTTDDIEEDERQDNLGISDNAKPDVSSNNEQVSTARVVDSTKVDEKTVDTRKPKIPALEKVGPQQFAGFMSDANELEVEISKIYEDVRGKLGVISDQLITPTIRDGFNSTKVEPIVDSEEISEISKKFLEDREKQIRSYIEELETITPAQKERLTYVAQKYKNVEIMGQRIEDIITNNTDVKIEKQELPFLKEYAPDVSMIQSSIASFDQSYMKKTFKRDLAACCTAFNEHGMFLIDSKEEAVADQLNRLRNFTLKYEDAKGKRHTVKFTLPEVDEDGRCLINGQLKQIKKQMVNLPICKVSPTRVSLVSNLNKTILERNVSKAHSFNNYIQKFIDTVNSEKRVFEVSYSAQNLNYPIAYEYSVLGRKFKFIKFQHPELGYVTLNFDYLNRESMFIRSGMKSTDKTEYFQDLEGDFGTLFGTVSDPEKQLFIDIHNVVRIIDTSTSNAVSKTTILDLMIEAAGTTPSTTLSEWVELKILDAKLPLIFVLSYRYGLLDILKYLKVKYQIVPNGARRASWTDHKHMKFKFKDSVLVVPRYPLTQSLIVAGLAQYDFREYNIEDLDKRDPYFALLAAKGKSANFLKGIDTFFDLFIDPITRDTLEQMKEPTNIKDLLIRATVMLTTEDHKDASSMSNFRIRSYERMISTVYKEMTRQYSTYKSRGNAAGNTFSLNPNAVLMAINSGDTLVNVDTINPIHDIKEKTNFSYMGDGGRTATSFVIDDRKYPKDAIGIMSEATVDSGKVATTAQTTFNPGVANTRGMLETRPVNELEPSNILSMTSLLMPAVTNDDGKRATFVNIQLSHHVPTAGGDVCRVRTGYERVVAHRCSAPFASTAQEDGVVVAVDRKANMLKVKYKNDTEEVFLLGEEYTDSSGVCITQKIKTKFKEGDSFKKGDVLTFNSEFFQEDLFSNQVDWKHGVNVNVILMETDETLEDASEITASLSKKLRMEPAHVRTLVLPKSTVVHEMVKVGQHVDNVDPLVVFEDMDMGDLNTLGGDNPELLALLRDTLSKTTPKAKHTGTVVKIDAFYSVPTDEMHPTLAKIVKDVIGQRNARHRFAKGTNREFTYPKSDVLPPDTKIKGGELDKDSVILQFHIREGNDAGAGDKLVVGTSLKSVVSNVLPEEIISEDGTVIELVFSASSVQNRIILSPVIIGSTQRVVEKLEKDILAIWDE